MLHTISNCDVIVIVLMLMDIVLFVELKKGVISDQNNLVALYINILKKITIPYFIFIT